MGRGSTGSSERGRGVCTLILLLTHLKVASTVRDNISTHCSGTQEIGDSCTPFAPSVPSAPLCALSPYLSDIYLMASDLVPEGVID
jgi:hypothetical protein